MEELEEERTEEIEEEMSEEVEEKMTKEVEDMEMIQIKTSGWRCLNEFSAGKRTVSELTSSIIYARATCITITMPISKLEKNK